MPYSVLNMNTWGSLATRCHESVTIQKTFITGHWVWSQWYMSILILTLRCPMVSEVVNNLSGVEGIFFVWVVFFVCVCVFFLFFFTQQVFQPEFSQLLMSENSHFWSFLLVSCVNLSYPVCCQENKIRCLTSVQLEKSRMMWCWESQPRSSLFSLCRLFYLCRLVKTSCIHHKSLQFPLI